MGGNGDVTRVRGLRAGVGVPSESAGVVVVVILRFMFNECGVADKSRSRSLVGVLVVVANMLVRDGVLNDALAADLLLTSLLRPISFHCIGRPIRDALGVVDGAPGRLIFGPTGPRTNQKLARVECLRPAGYDRPSYPPGAAGADFGLFGAALARARTRRPRSRAGQSR